MYFHLFIYLIIYVTARERMIRHEFQLLCLILFANVILLFLFRVYEKMKKRKPNTSEIVR